MGNAEYMGALLANTSSSMVSPFALICLAALAIADPAAEPKAAADPKADPYYGYYGLGHYGYGLGYYGYGLGHGYYYGKRAAEPAAEAAAEPTAAADAKADPSYGHSGLGHSCYGLG